MEHYRLVVMVLGAAIVCGFPGEARHREPGASAAPDGPRAPGALAGAVSAQQSNSKEVTPIGWGAGGYIGLWDTLTYTIQFQNLGTDTVADITIIDTLDADLDTATLELLAGSHPFVSTRNGFELTWTFTGIQLPDSASDETGSHGFVEYSIAPVLQTCEEQQFVNRAWIYFDTDPAVSTNTVLNSFFCADCIITLDGDVTNSGTVTSADIIALVRYCFKSGPEPLPCEAAGDLNCDGAVTASDIIYEVNFCFKGGVPPCDICTFSPLITSCT
jgi:hypothetical protein